MHFKSACNDDYQVIQALFIAIYLAGVKPADW